MRLSYYTNIIKLKDNEYLLLKPFSRPLVVDKEAVRAINSDDSHSELINILNKENFKKYRNRNILNMEKCKNCQYRFICGGGCSFNSYPKTGDIFNPDCKTMENLKEFFRLYKETISGYEEGTYGCIL